MTQYFAIRHCLKGVIIEAVSRRHVLECPWPQDTASGSGSRQRVAEQGSGAEQIAAQRNRGLSNTGNTRALEDAT